MRESVLMVGSVNLDGPEEVFRAVASAVGDRVASIPDGETDERIEWVSAQEPVLARLEQLENVGEEGVGADGEYRRFSKFRIRDGVAADDIDFGSLGYAEHAGASYSLFSRLRDEGLIPAGVRFQVSIPTPLAIIFAYVDARDQLAIETPYERQMLAEIRALAASIPHDDLAIQWDVAVEMAMIEGVFPTYVEGDLLTGLLERLTRLGGAVPQDVALGYHLCYGNAGNVHWKEPADTANLVAVANGIAAQATRHADWLHLPVPIERDDAAYFEPLRDLRLDPRTRLFLGLVHKEDGVEGAKRRIAAARTSVADFGVGTECGMGREPREAVPGLIALHADVARELDSEAT